MILKIDISVSLLLMLTVNLVNADYWRTTNFIIPITKQFVAKFRVDSRLRCFEQCSTHFSSLLVNIQDGDCFCLTSHPDSNWTGGEVTLISFMSRRSEQWDCISKGYTIYHALGVCIKYIASRKTWQEAKRHCNQDGGYLINLNTLEKYTASLNIMISEFQTQIFVGAFSAFWDNGNTKYHWTRGDEIYRFWLNGEPSITEVEICINMFNFHSTANGLNNLPCEISQPFLCELLL